MQKKPIFDLLLSYFTPTFRNSRKPTFDLFFTYFDFFGVSGLLGGRPPHKYFHAASKLVSELILRTRTLQPFNHTLSGTRCWKWFLWFPEISLKNCNSNKLEIPAARTNQLKTVANCQQLSVCAMNYRGKNLGHSDFDCFTRTKVQITEFPYFSREKRSEFRRERGIYTNPS